MGIVCLSHAIEVIENRIIGDDHYCPFFPNNPVGDVSLKLLCNIIGFYLPIIIVLLNFKTVRKTDEPEVNQTTFRVVMHHKKES